MSRSLGKSGIHYTNETSEVNLKGMYPYTQGKYLECPINGTNSKKFMSINQA